MKIGTVPFINAKPVTYSLENIIVEKYPNQLRDALLKGECDVALLPVVELFGLKEAKVVPNISISSKERAKSVRLFFRKDLNSFNVVHLDPYSVTSNLLAKVIFSEKYNIKPDFIATRSYSHIEDASTTAFVAIGDYALKLFYEQKIDFNSIDLVEEWYSLTDTPFVFAVWATFSNDKSICKTLTDAKNEGLKNIESVIEKFCIDYGFNYDFVSDYVKNCMFYDLDEDCLKGIEMFHNLLVKEKFIQTSFDKRAFLWL